MVVQRAKSGTAIAHFSALLISMGSFLNGCASLPQFRKGASLLEWLFLSALENRGDMRLRLLCYVLGISARRAQVVIRSLQKSGYIQVDRDLLSITDAGRKKLADVNAELADLIDLGPRVSVRLERMDKSVRLLSRIWQKKAATPAQEPGL